MIKIFIILCVCIDFQVSLHDWLEEQNEQNRIKKYNWKQMDTELFLMSLSANDNEFQWKDH